MKKIAIVFPYAHLAYSPTTLNLMAELKKKFAVTLITFRNDNYAYYHKLQDESIVYLKETEKLSYVEKKTMQFRKLFTFKGVSNQQIIKKKQIEKYVREHDFERIIAVDSEALWYVKDVDRGKIDFLSLELNDFAKGIFKEIQTIKMENLLIQDQNRLEINQLKNYKNHFFIQNSPPYFSDITKDDFNLGNVNKLVYAGTAIARFGLFSCVSFVNNHKEYSLTIMGPIDPDTLNSLLVCYPNLMHEKRIVIKNDYLTEHDYCAELSKYSIGFCFYEFFHPDIAKNFNNYYHAPSGKLFKYFASGVPVIGNDIPGLQDVVKFDAGVLLKEATEENIQQAIAQITAKYSDYSQNCFKAARHNDFSQNAAMYINHLLSE